MKQGDLIMAKLSQIEDHLAKVEREFLPLREAARFLDLSVSAIYALTSSGGIPFYRPNGKKIFFDKADLVAWLTRNRSASNEEIAKKAGNHVEARG